MPWVKARCKICGTTKPPISRHHLCTDCAINNIKANAHQIRDRNGPTFEKYKAGVLNYLNKPPQKNAGEDDGNS